MKWFVFLVASLLPLAGTSQTLTASPASCVTGEFCRPRLTWSGFPCAAPTATSMAQVSSWSGPKAPSGSQLVSSMTATRTFILTCPEILGSTGSTALSWDPPTMNTDGSPLTNLAGYKVYWGTTAGDYPNSVTVNNPGVSGHVVDQLSDATWHFAVTAFSTTGAESSFSNTASKTIQGNTTIPAVSRSVTVVVGPAETFPPGAPTGFTVVAPVTGSQPGVAIVYAGVRTDFAFTIPGNGSTQGITGCEYEFTRVFPDSRVVPQSHTFPTPVPADMSVIVPATIPQSGLWTWRARCRRGSDAGAWGDAIIPLLAWIAPVSDPQPL